MFLVLVVVVRSKDEDCWDRSNRFRVSVLVLGEDVFRIGVVSSIPKWVSEVGGWEINLNTLCYYNNIMLNA